MSIDGQLRSLPVLLRVAFAASCAERILPAYEKYCAQGGFAPVLVDRLAFIWSAVLGERAAHANEVRDLFDEDSRTLVPPETAGAEYAQDAASAVLYALLALAPEGDEDIEGPAFAAQHVGDALDRYVARLTDTQPDDPAYGARVTNHPYLREERDRQLRDLRELLNVVDQRNEWEHTVTNLRDRAVRERLVFLQTPPQSARLS
jgi:hypothetical protein